MRLFVKIFFVFYGSLSCILVFGQNATLDIKGTVDNDTTGSRLDSVNVQLINSENGVILQSVYTPSNGKYKFDPIPVNSIYKIAYTKKNYVGKFIILDGKDVPVDDNGFLPMEINIRMDLGNNESDYYFLLFTPFAIARYNKSMDNLEWDNKYIEMIQGRMKEIKSKKLWKN